MAFMNQRFVGVIPGCYRLTWQRVSLFLIATLLLSFACASQVHAHAVAEGDKGYIQEISGVVACAVRDGESGAVAEKSVRALQDRCVLRARNRSDELRKGLGSMIRG